MRRGPWLLILLAGLASCAKRADEAASAPASQAAPMPAQAPGAAAPETPSPEPASDEEAPSSAAPPPPPGASPVPGPAKKSEAEKRKTTDALKQDRADGFGSLSEAEAAFAKAKTDLESLVVVGDKAVALSGGDSKCERACRAFSSLERAADGICRIAGDDDARCGKARGVVNEHRPRVSACGCED